MLFDYQSVIVRNPNISRAEVYNNVQQTLNYLPDQDAPDEEICRRPIALAVRRGRPKSTQIIELILEGSQSVSRIKCKICNRDFPRNKSLQAHIRTHTGERPYVCDYPRCCKEFKQSGQLKTHLRIHTGEAPYYCNVDGCTTRFKHKNRKCPLHPQVATEKDPDPKMDIKNLENLDEECLQWFEKYRQEKNKTKRKRSQSPDNEIRSEMQQLPITDSENSHDSESSKEEELNRKRPKIQEEQEIRQSWVLEGRSPEEIDVIYALAQLSNNRTLL